MPEGRRRDLKEQQTISPELVSNDICKKIYLGKPVLSSLSRYSKVGTICRLDLAELKFCSFLQGISYLAILLFSED